MTAAAPPEKPLGRKAYGHIAHLPGSRMGPGDHKCHEGQARIATQRARDKHDRIIVQEKLDGTCVAVAKIEAQIVPLIRAGYRADSSHYQQHHMFAEWVVSNAELAFDKILDEGERAVGEWLAQAHGTRYDLRRRDPFVLFDIIRGSSDKNRAEPRITWEELRERAADIFYLPYVLNDGQQPMLIEAAMEALDTYGFYGALDPVEGAVWRVERQGKVDFLAKYVRPDKVDGYYLEDVSGKPPIWNWPA